MLRILIAGSVLIAAGASAHAQPGEGGPYLPAAPQNGYQADAPLSAPDDAHVVTPGAPAPEGVSYDEALHCHAIGATLSDRAVDGAIGARLMNGFSAFIPASLPDYEITARMQAVRLSTADYTLDELTAEVEACNASLSAAAGPAA